MNPWKTVQSTAVYENPWIRVREDRVIRPDGKPGIYGVVEVSPSIVVAAIDAEGRIALVGQWRYTRNRYAWELPLGGSHAHETDLQAVAVRELREETGAEAASWTFLGTVDACVGVTTDTQWIYLATELTKHESKPDPEERLEVRWVPFEEAVQRVWTGEICEAGSVTAILKVESLRRRAA